MLDVGDGQQVWFGESGNPDGIPVVCLHGGPGGGGSRGGWKAFDPAVFRTVLFDQRGCGESVPNVWASTSASNDGWCTGRRGGRRSP